MLVKYVGWGGIPHGQRESNPHSQVFAQQTSTEWEAERERLKNILSSEEYETARASTLNAHYTSPTVVSVRQN